MTQPRSTRRRTKIPRTVLRAWEPPPEFVAGPNPLRNHLYHVTPMLGCNDCLREKFDL